MQTRVVVYVVVLTALVTVYSLTELHSLSVAHAEQEGKEENAGRPQLEEEEEHHVVASSSTTLPLHTVDVGTQASSISSSTGTSTGSKSSKAKLSASAAAHKCYFYPNTDLWGDVLVSGYKHRVDSAAACCDACRSYEPKEEGGPGCNVFVYCDDEQACKDDFKQCWLKHLAHPTATRPAKQGPHVPWTGGTLDVNMDADPVQTTAKAASDARRFHVVTSAQGSAVHWQARVHYYWYKKQRARCEKEGPCEMGGFTRLLHSGEPDDLVDEIPTMVVDPLPSDMVEHSSYVVLNRPYAFVQWVKKANIPEKYVLMAEPDHVFLRPLPNLMVGETPASFPFFYIEPAKKEFENVTTKFTGPLTHKELEQLAPIGNSPTFMNMDDMRKTMPLWMNTSIAVFKDADANKVWGWVQEMYGFTIACWLAGIKKIHLHMNLMAQPPWDTKLNMTPKKPFYILHYTYGMDYNMNGEFTPGKYGAWRFDKRTYSMQPIPRHLGDPPPGMTNELVRALLNAFNEATEAIPCWDEYQKTGKVPKTCSEEPKHFLAEQAAAVASSSLKGSSSVGGTAKAQAASDSGHGDTGGSSKLVAGSVRKGLNAEQQEGKERQEGKEQQEQAQEEEVQQGKASSNAREDPDTDDTDGDDPDIATTTSSTTTASSSSKSTKASKSAGETEEEDAEEVEGASASKTSSSTSSSRRALAEDEEEQQGAQGHRHAKGARSGSGKQAGGAGKADSDGATSRSSSRKAGAGHGKRARGDRADGGSGSGRGHQGRAASRGTGSGSDE